MYLRFCRRASTMPSTFLLILAAATAWAAPYSHEPGPPSRALDPYIAAFREAKADSLKSLALFHLMGALERQEVALDDSAGAYRLASFLAGVLDSERARLVRLAAAMLLKRNAHPAAGEALYRAAKGGGRESVLTRMAAVNALVSLGDWRALGPIQDMLAQEDPHGGTTLLRLIAELGSPDGIPILEKAGADSTSSGERREEARRALRDLKLRLETGFYCPRSLDDRAIDGLRRHGFVMRPSQKNEMYELYDEIYPFVTSDVAWHTFFILTRGALDELDHLVLAPRLGNFVRDAKEASLQQAKQLDGDPLGVLAIRNAELFAVCEGLLTGGDAAPLGLPDASVGRVGDELRRIGRHSGIARSEVLGYEEDYTKYAPRGRMSPADSGRFSVAMRYIGRAIFPLDSLDQTRRALLLASLIADSQRLRDEWHGLDALLTELFGPSDDLSVEDYIDAASEGAAAKAPGRAAFLQRLRSDSWVRSVVDALRRHPAPRINVMFLRPEAAASWRSAAAGLRILGQRYTRPIDVLQQSMDRLNWPPSGLDVAGSLLGSVRAQEISQAAGRPLVEAPPVPQAAGGPAFASLAEEFLRCGRPLFATDPRAPAFMHRQAWEEKQLNSALGAWAELQHATTAYVKDANHYMGGSAVIDRFHGYVEPVPEFFARLAGCTRRFADALEEVGLFARMEADRKAALDSLGPDIPPSEWGPNPAAQSMLRTRRAEARIRPDRAAFDELASILQRLSAIARAELDGKGQSISDGYFLKNLGARLRILSFNRSNANHALESMALITDVATEYQSGTCLEIGVGSPAEIYAAVTDGARTFVCRGAAYTYFEFVQDIKDRHSDSEWRRLLQDPFHSGPAPWISTRPDLGYSWTLSRRELEGLGRIQSEDGASSGGYRRYHVAEYRNSALTFTAARVDPADLDLLIALVGQDTLNLGVRAFALGRLADFAGDPRAVACLAGQLDRLERTAAPYPTDLQGVQLYGIIRALGRSTPAAVPLLDRAEALARRWEAGPAPGELLEESQRSRRGLSRRR